MIDWEWFRETDFSAYSGEWVAIEQKKVVAHSRTFLKLANLLDKYAINHEKVMFYRVPEKREIRI